MPRPAIMLTVAALVVSAAALATPAIEPLIIDSPPPEYTAFRASALDPAYLSASTTLSGVPAAMWWYGCSATSAGMMFGYYDSHGYDNMFAGTIDGNIDTATERSLIATPDHVTDYWTATDYAGPDPWESGGTEHTWADCTADFMGTNQWKWDYAPFLAFDGETDANKDGQTTFWYVTDGAPLHDPHIGAMLGEDLGAPDISGCSGLRLFAESRGYSVAFADGEYQNYNQYCDAYMGDGSGFTYEQYKAQIDAGRPVLVQLNGHTVLGYGYNDATTDDIVLYDTWDYLSHSMTWGTSYGGMAHVGVTVLELEPQQTPEPGTLGLFGLGALAAAMWLKRRTSRPGRGRSAACRRLTDHVNKLSVVHNTAKQ